MKSFVIALSSHTESQLLASVALDTARQYNWQPIEQFSAIDGRVVSLQDYSIKLANSTKCAVAFERPGVVGCFLSHYCLWSHCVAINEPIAVFEHDVIFAGPPEFDNNFEHVLRFDKSTAGKNYGTGTWWQGSHAYVIKPAGAVKLLQWVNDHGALPSDVMLGTAVVDIQFELTEKVLLNRDHQSFTRKNTF